MMVFIDKLLNLLLNDGVKRAFVVPTVAPDDFSYGAGSMLIGGLLVLHLPVVLSEQPDFALALLAQHVAHFFGNW